MRLFVIVLSILSTSIGALQEIDIEDKHYWRSLGSATLHNILNRKQQNGVAKNVIVFVGDGMGISTVTMARIYQGQIKTGKGETNELSFEKFPSVGLSKTYDVNYQVPDSAATATAMFSGVKIKHYTLGLDAMASYNICNAEIDKTAKVLGAMTWAQTKGKDTGIVTTTRVTHATPAATYAHINNRDWECDSEIPRSDVTCVKDIARQLVEDAPGKRFKVIMGGGRQQFGVKEAKQGTSCVRTDGKNLVEMWKQNKKNAKYVTNANELAAVDTTKTDYLLGLFSPCHLDFVGENNPDRPSLKMMTETAIKILQKNPEGFVLLVEGGRIDSAHHKNQAKLALLEALEFDEAIAAAVNMTNPEETLIIVTADHSHSVVMNGYPRRGNDILGLAESTENSFFETITYTNGPGFEYHHPMELKENCKKNCTDTEKQSANNVRDIRNDPTRYQDVHYQHFASFYREDETHGGEDVGVYSSGPMSHLLVGVFEQNYIAHVISYASCIGPEEYRCKSRKMSSSSSIVLPQNFLLYLLFLLAVLKFNVSL